ncbi:hypothetical protein ACK6ST_18115 [Proteus terrae]|uniref:hypothetical protein n=1 Tax=Proteus terrae TaxID=1574161 RepID=UPI003C2C3912
MKNNKFDVNEVYSMIRAFYIKKMPYETVFSPIGTINLYLKVNSKSNAQIIITENNSYQYTENAEEPIDDWDEILFDLNKMEMEFFKKEENIINLISDLTELQKWLTHEGYITEHGVIKGKMVEAYRLN